MILIFILFRISRFGSFTISKNKTLSSSMGLRTETKGPHDFKTCLSTGRFRRDEAGWSYAGFERMNRLLLGHDLDGTRKSEAARAGHTILTLHTSHPPSRMKYRGCGQSFARQSSRLCPRILIMSCLAMHSIPSLRTCYFFYIRITTYYGEGITFLIFRRLLIFTLIFLLSPPSSSSPPPFLVHTSSISPVRTRPYYPMTRAYMERMVVMARCHSSGDGRIEQERHH